MNQHFSIGDIAKITGISRDRLRNYEKQGLISPIRNDENEYREYDKFDLLKVYSIQLFRSMGFGIEEIKELIAESEVEEVINRLQERNADIDREIQRLQAQQQLLEEVTDDCMHIKQETGKISIRKIRQPRLQQLSTDCERKLNDFSKIYESIEKNASVMRHFVRKITFNDTAILSNEVYIAFPTDEYKECVCTIIQDTHEPHVMERAFEACMQWVSTQQVPIEYCAYIRPLITNHLSEKSISYLEVTVPVIQ